jgi:hypothetical protein
VSSSVVGKGPFGPAWGAGNLVTEVLAKMLDAEHLYPLVALWRREQTDSGGPGRQRAG